MKALLLVVASLSLFNENSSIIATFNDLFVPISSTFVSSEQTYTYITTFSQSNIDQTDFMKFKNGSSKLVLKLDYGLNIDTTRTNDFYIEIDTIKYYFELELGYVTDMFYTIPNFMQFDYHDDIDLYISIPTLHTSAVQNYENAFVFSVLYTKDAFYTSMISLDYAEGYADGYDLGVENGFAEGYALGEYEGYEAGYENGFEVGANNNDEMSGLFVLLGQGFSSLASILAIQLFPGFTLGTLLFLPLLFGIAFVLFKFLLGGSS